MIERTSGTTVTTGFPLYDAHGNNVAALYGYLGDMAQARGSLVGAMLGTIYQGAKLGAEAAMICYAYQMRLSYYLDSIDD